MCRFPRRPAAELGSAHKLRGHQAPACQIGHVGYLAMDSLIDPSVPRMCDGRL